MDFVAVYSGSESGDAESPEYTPSMEGDKPMISFRNRRRSWTWWPLIGLCLACAVPALAAETLGQEEARELVDEIVPRVEELRGLKFKRPVSVEVVGAAEIREYVLARMKKFEQEQHLLAVQRAYALLGLLPEGTDLLAMLLQTMEDQAGGYYDPSTKAYYLMENVVPAAAPIFTAHELTHALEDQHFDLDRRLKQAIDNDDRLLAQSAVHEGTATVLMGVYAAGAVMRGELDMAGLQSMAESEAERMGKLQELPEVLLRQLLGPYVLGALFLTGGDLMAMARGFPRDKVEQVMGAGPQSSEQLLHPDKYWDEETRDDPTEVELPDTGKTLGRGWKLEGDGVLGELTLGPLVGAETPFNPAVGGLADPGTWTNEAASGWDGDRWQLWKDGEAAVVLLLTEWDTARDAEEFANALPERERLAWQVDGRRVAVVAGDAGKKTPKLLKRLLN